MGLRSRSVLGCAWLLLNLLAVSAMAQAARNELEEKFRITSFDDDVEIGVRLTMTGAEANRERAFIATTASASLQRQYLRPYLRRYGPRTMAVGDLDVKDDTANNVLTVTLKMTAPTGVRDNDTNWTMYYAAENVAGVLPRPNALGDTVYRYAMEMQFPADVAVTGNPSAKKISDPAFDFSADSSFFGNRAVAVMELKMRAQPPGAIQSDPARLSKYQVASRLVDESVKGSMFVSKEGVRVRRLLAIEQPTLRQLTDHNSANTIERTTKAIDGKQLRGAQLAQVHCQRASALVAQGKLPDALRDANLGVEAAPAEMSAYRCRASVLANMGDTASATADYNKVIEVEPLAGTTYLFRGIVSFYGGQLANAADDFDRSQRAHEARGDVSFSTALWRTLALKRLGRPPDPALVQLAAEQPRGPWPRPTVALVHGLIGVDEMMEIAQRRSGIEREMAMVEAWFAAGQWYLMQGDKPKAAEAFRKVRELGVAGFVEYRSAAAELAVLEAAGK